MSKHEINAFLGPGTRYQGRLEFTGTVRIDGDFEGDIVSDGALLIGREATVRGRIVVGQLLCSGKMEAEARAARKAVLHKTAEFRGDLFAPALVIEEGARMEGEVTMGADSTSQPALT